MTDVLSGGGEMGRLMRSLDWAATPIGPVEGWPQSLRTAVRICLTTRFPMLICWGPELIMLYNDAYRPILGATKHPRAMGQPGRECWPEIWGVIGPMLEGVLGTGAATRSDDQLLLLDRNGYLEECYFTFSYSPIPDEAGEVGGVLCAVIETTGRVLGERRLRTLLAAARAYEAERQRAGTLAEIDRTKTAFFADVSHELHTPLTLPPETSPAPYAAGSARILVAEDDADMRDYVEWLLSQKHTVVAVTNGDAALEAARAGEFDLLLADVMIPGLDGFALIRALRADERTRHIPAILLSARAGEEARIEGMEAGADDYLTKPFSARELLARVHAQLASARLRGEAVQREQRLREAAEVVREQLEQILEGIKDDFVMYDDEWRYVYVNEQAARSLGYPKGQLIGRRIWDLFPDAVGNRFYEQMVGAKAAGREAVFEHYYAPWGKWIENRAYPLPNGMLLFAADITERKQAELERVQLYEAERTARAAAEQAARERDELLAYIAHDLKNPLTALLAATQLLQRRLRGPATIDLERLQRGLGTIEQTAMRLAAQLNELQDVASLQAGQPLDLQWHGTDLVALVERVVAIRQAATEQHQIRIDTPLADLLCICDPFRIERVITNLLANAVKYSPHGGEITVVITREMNEAADWAMVEVRDHGMGIPAADLPHIFERFYRGQNVAGQSGSGLGLASAQAIIVQHGGEVSVASELGQGSVVTVRLPLKPPTTPPPPAGAVC